MRRFFKSAAFPILLVVILAFVAQRVISPGSETEPPSLYGRAFHRNEAFGLWVLHVWHFRHNPAGMFMDWNPTVSCRYATP